VFARELAAGYGERTGAGPADLPPLPVRYAEHARRQRERLAGDRLARGLEHWRTRLTGLAPLRLPTDRPDRPTGTAAGDVTRFTVPADLVAAADRMARTHRSTRFMVLLAAFQVLLGRHTGQTDLAVGTPSPGGTGSTSRTWSDCSSTRWCCGPTCPAGRRSPRCWTGSGAACSATLGHAEVPFDRVVSEVAPRRDLGRHPLFQVSFSLLNGDQNGDGTPVRLPGWTCGWSRHRFPVWPCDLVLDLIRCPDGRLAGRLQFATALFDADTAAQLGDGLPDAAAGPAGRPGRTGPGGGAPGAAAASRERSRLLAAGNDTAAPLPALTVTELVERRSGPPRTRSRCGRPTRT
jgi:hypothetical protein